MSATVILLPGLLTDATLFAEQIPALSTLGPTQVADLTRADTIDQLADDVLAQSPAGPLVLVGFSMGGYVAFEIMRKAPERVSGLVLLDTSARPDTDEARSHRAQLISRAKSDYHGVVETLLPKFAHPDHVHEPRVRGVLQSMASSLGAAVFERHQRAIMNRADSRYSLVDIACPTLVIVGRDDALTPPEHAIEITEGIARARLEIIDTSGHLTPLEQPACVTSLLVDFVREINRAPQAPGATPPEATLAHAQGWRPSARL